VVDGLVEAVARFRAINSGEYMVTFEGNFNMFG